MSTSSTDDHEDDMAATVFEPDDIPYDGVDFDFDLTFSAIKNLLHVARPPPSMSHEKRKELLEKAHMAGSKAMKRLSEVRRRVITGDKTKRVRDFIKEARIVRTIDKFSFTFGVIVLLIIEYFFFKQPHLFGIMYMLLIVPLLAYRWYAYSRTKNQYFMIDFCYLVNWSSIVTIFYPNLFGGRLLKSCFVMANGPVAMAILTWRNSLVFHSLDKITSVYIHALPALLTYCWRWLPGNEYMLVSQCEGSECTIELSEVFYFPLIMYMTWQVAYLFWTEVVDRKKFLEDEELQTSLRYLTRSSGGMKSFTVKVCTAIGLLRRNETLDPEALKTKLIFVSAQLVYTVVTIIPTIFYFNYEWAHALFLLACLGSSVFNGATYYVEVFSRRYMDSLNAIEERQRKLESAVEKQEKVAAGQHQEGKTSKSE